MPWSEYAYAQASLVWAFSGRIYHSVGNAIIIIFAIDLMKQMGETSDQLCQLLKVYS